MHRFTYGQLTFEIGIPEGMAAAEAEHSHLMNVCPDYKWLSFRRSLIGSPEYQLAVGLAMGSNPIAVADAKITAAIDACATHGALPEEVAAFQSALGLYLSVLPDNEDSIAIRNCILALCESHNIATGIED
jgi:hypothetical protein